MGNNDSASNSNLNLIIGFLLGTGGLGGAAIALIGKEGSQWYGVAALIICVAAAVFLYLYVLNAEERKHKAEMEERKRYSSMNELNTEYVERFRTTGENIFIIFQSKEKMKDKITIREVFNNVAFDLSRQAETTKRVWGKVEARKELADLYSEGLNQIANTWKEIANKEIAEESSSEVSQTNI